MSSFPERVKLTPGSKIEFWVNVEDETQGRGVNLFQKVTKALFCNCKGESIEVTIDTDNDDARCGSLFVKIPSAKSIKMDKESEDFDIEYIDIDGEPIVIPVSNTMEFNPRNCKSTDS